MASNALVPPNMNPLQNPMMPPPSPALGFQAWASDPQNAHKVVPSMTSPNQPLQPNAGQPASAAPPLAPWQTTMGTQNKGMLQPGNINIWNRPTVQNTDGSHSSEYSTSFGDAQGREILVPTIANGRFLTPDGTKPAEGSPDEKAMFQRAQQYYERTGQNLGIFSNPDDADTYASAVHNRGDLSPIGKIAQQARPQAMASAAPPAGAPVNFPQSAPTLPTHAPQVQTQLAADTAKSQQLQQSGAGVDQIKSKPLRVLAKIGDIAGSILAPGVSTFIPGTTMHHDALLSRANNQIGRDQQAQQYANQQQQFGTQQQLDAANLAHTQAETQKLQNPAPEKPESVEQQYSDAVADAMSRGVDPNTEPKVQQLLGAITGLKPKESKEPAKDDRAIQIYSKPEAQRTPEEIAYLKGYEKYVKTTKVDPGVARTSVLLQIPTAIADPNNPGGVIYTTRQGAIGQKAPTDIGTTVAKDVTKTATSGPVGQQLLAIGTAREHMKTFGTLADALNNGDVQTANKLANAFGIQFGNDKATNLRIAAQAFGGEVGRAFDGAGVTAGERASAEKAYSDDLSKGQFKGAISTVDQLLAGKQKAAQDWYNSGVKGKPDFGNPMQPPSTSGAPQEGATKKNSHGDTVVFHNGAWGPA